MIKQVEFKTSFYKEDLFTKFKIKQDDTLIMKVKIDDAPEDFYFETARILLKRGDKSVMYEEINVTCEDNIVTFTAPPGTTDISGTTYGELEFTDDETFRSSTFVFVFDVVSRSANINEVIESKDEIFIIKEIRDFILQTKQDLINLDVECKTLKDKQKELDEKIETETRKVEELIYEVESRDLNVEEIKAENERAENNIEDLEVLNKKAQELKDTSIESIAILSQEAIQNIDEMKGNVISLVEDNCDTSLDKINNLKDDTIEEIEELKYESIDEIQETRDEAIDTLIILNDESIKNIDQIKTNSLNLILDTKDDAIKEIEDTKNDFENIAENSKGELKKVINDAKNVSDELKEEIVEGNTLLPVIREVLQDGKETNMSLVENTTRADNLKQELITKISNANSIKELLDNAVITANNTKDSILEAIENGNNKSSELEGLLNSITNIEEQLRLLVETSNVNIEELEILHPASDIRIEELKRLIELAKQYEEVVRTWISNREPAINLDEVNAKLEELYNAVETLNAKFVDYYTKVEVDEKINTYKGEIGYSEYKPKPEGFDEAFEKLLEDPTSIHLNMNGEVVEYIQGTISRTTGTNTSGVRRAGVLLITNGGYYNNDARPIIENSNNQNREFDIIKFRRADNSNISATFVKNFTYPCIFNSETGKFERGLDPSSSETYSMTDYYYSTVDIYENDNATIAYPACEGEIETKISDFNEAVEGGAYKVNIKEGEVIANTPLEGAIQGILNVNKAKDVIHQELSTNKDEVFSRIHLNSNWTEWKATGASDIDMTNIYTKEEVDNLINDIDSSSFATKEELQEVINNIKKVGVIKGGDPNFREPVWDVLPENTFKNIPANPDPDTYLWEMKCSHYNYHMVFYFPTDPTGRFGIVQRTDGKLGFKLLDNSFTYTTYKAYYKKKDTSTSWSSMPSDNHFTNPEKRELEAMYSHNFDIVDANNPDVIFRYGSQNDFNAEFIKDFNDATECEVYNVEAVEDSIIENSPVSGSYKGILKVDKADKMIYQTLETINNEIYKRVYDKEWSKWRVINKKPNTEIISILNKTMKLTKGGI